MLMRWSREKRPDAAVEALEKVGNSEESRGRKFLLAQIVQAYAPLDKDQRINLTNMLRDAKEGGLPVVRTLVDD